MSHLAIHAEGLTKQYHIGARREKYHTLRDTLANTVSAPLRLLRSHANGASGETIYALKDVSFEVHHGEVLGIIGRNGAGKSTLLKILSSITEPSAGYVDVYGRVGSLLEVGTGFHPELSGRENIYLNGAILGMRRVEIARKFDEIVAFSEIEPFIETPVKHYSSGMYMRLAFAVAAHLEPEILIVDEVLAVGDAAFQQKCLGKMDDVAQKGRTVLFVSHNMAAVMNLCKRGIVLQNGVLQFDGPVDEAVNHYMMAGSEADQGTFDLTDHPKRRASSVPVLDMVRFLDSRGNAKSIFQTGEDLYIEFSVTPPRPLRQPFFGVGFDDVLGVRLFSLTSQYSKSGVELPVLDEPCKVVCCVPELPLAPGRYLLSLSAGTARTPLLDALNSAITLEVEAGDFFGVGKLPPATAGKFMVRTEWTMSMNEVGEFNGA